MIAPYLGQHARGGTTRHNFSCRRLEGTENMAARKKKKATRRKAKPADLIISKSRTKNATKKCNVSSEFYGALDAHVRDIIKGAEARAIGNKRKTIKAVDI